MTTLKAMLKETEKVREKLSPEAGKYLGNLEFSEAIRVAYLLKDKTDEELGKITALDLEMMMLVGKLSSDDLNLFLSFMVDLAAGNDVSGYYEKAGLKQ